MKGGLVAVSRDDSWHGKQTSSGGRRCRRTGPGCREAGVGRFVLLCSCCQIVWTVGIQAHTADRRFMME